MYTHCPFCSERYKLKDHIFGNQAKCPHCGKTFQVEEEEDTYDVTSDPAPETATEPCLHCGSTQLSSAGICAECGYNFHTGEVVKRQARSAARKGPSRDRKRESGWFTKRRVVVAAIVGVLVVAAVVVGIVLVRQPEPLVVQQDGKTVVRPTTPPDAARIAKLYEVIKNARKAATVFDFAQARDSLEGIRDEVTASNDEYLIWKYQQGTVFVEKSEQNHKNKLDRGYIIYDGKLITQKQKDDILQRKEKLDYKRRLLETQRNLFLSDPPASFNAFCTRFCDSLREKEAAVRGDGMVFSLAGHEVVQRAGSMPHVGVLKLDATVKRRYYSSIGKLEEENQGPYRRPLEFIAANEQWQWSKSGGLAAGTTEEAEGGDDPAAAESVKYDVEEITKLLQQVVDELAVELVEYVPGSG